MGKEYFEKFKDPRWQARRLEVFQRDLFHCQLCDANDRTLSVHHKYYEFGLDPWEYDLESLVTVCDVCHEKADAMRKEIRYHAACVGDQDLLLGAIRGLRLRDAPFAPQNYEQFAGMCATAFMFERHRGCIPDPIMFKYADEIGSKTPLTFAMLIRLADEIYPEGAQA